MGTDLKHGDIFGIPFASTLDSLDQSSILFKTQATNYGLIYGENREYGGCVLMKTI